MKRLAIFAHYDKQSVIDEYVIFYLESLKKNVDKIVFVSDCALSESELKKIDHLVFFNICEEHGEYDFGSYKRGFNFFKKKYPSELLDIDELVFANDSCYCLRDFDNIFKDVENKNCDAWSLGDDYENPYNNFYITKKYYLQSYFIVFRKSVFLESFFQNFLKQIKKLDSKFQIIFEYEEGLGRLLNTNNKKLFAYFAANRISHHLCDHYLQKIEALVNLIKDNSSFNDNEARFLIDGSFDISRINYIHSNKFYFLLELGFPLIKRSIICQNISSFNDEKLTFFWKEIVKKFTPFDTNIISDHLARISVKEKKPSDIVIETSFKHQVNQISQQHFFHRLISKKTLLQIKRTKSNRLLVKLLKIPVISKCLSKKNDAQKSQKKLTVTNFKSPLTQDKKSVSRLAIFAHYDKQSIIEDYVIDYLKSLREVAKRIIFVSDCILSSEELLKLDGIIEKIIFEKHGEYDFGSYKRGLLFAIKESNNSNKVTDKLEYYDQLIIANDSCYLVNSLAPAFKEMENRNSSDFWGMTQNTEQFLPHIQSYFVVFNKNVFLHQGFQNFFLSVKKETAKLEIIANYEVGLTQNLLELGFKKDSFIKKVFDKNPTLSEKFITELPKDFPLIKVPLLNRILWKKSNQKIS